MPEVTTVSDSEKKLGDHTDKNAAFYDRMTGVYVEMHQHQTYKFAADKKKEYCKFDHAEMTMMEALDVLSKWVDESDPDVDIPFIVHAFQVGERARKCYPDLEWLQVTAFIHDMGKMLAMFGEPQWSTTGHTFPLGCAFSEKIVLGLNSFKENADLNHPVYSTKLGVYKENCGLDNVTMSWGHDEYLYHVLKNHPECRIPELGLRITKYHSFYPWHKENDYKHLCTAEDEALLQWVKTFKTFDLYSKADAHPDIESLMSYYSGLVEKYVPGKIKW